VFDFFEAECEVVGPECGAFSDGCGLCGLVVGEGERGEITEFESKTRKNINDVGKFNADDFQRIAELDEFGVAIDKLAGGSEVDDRPGGRRDIGEGADVSHDVMLGFGFVFRDGSEVDIFDVCVEFGDLFG